MVGFREQGKDAPSLGSGVPSHQPESSRGCSLCKMSLYRVPSCHRSVRETEAQSKAEINQLEKALYSMLQFPSLFQDT